MFPHDNPSPVSHSSSQMHGGAANDPFAGRRSPNPARNSEAQNTFILTNDYLRMYQSIYTQKPSADWDEKLRRLDLLDQPEHSHLKRADDFSELDRALAWREQQLCDKERKLSAEKKKLEQEKEELAKQKAAIGYNSRHPELSKTVLSRKFAPLQEIGLPCANTHAQKSGSPLKQVFTVPGENEEPQQTLTQPRFKPLTGANKTLLEEVLEFVGLRVMSDAKVAALTELKAGMKNGEVVVPTTPYVTREILDAATVLKTSLMVRNTTNFANAKNALFHLTAIIPEEQLSEYLHTVSASEYSAQCSTISHHSSTVRILNVPSHVNGDDLCVFLEQKVGPVRSICLEKQPPGLSTKTGRVTFELPVTAEQVIRRSGTLRLHMNMLKIELIAV